MLFYSSVTYLGSISYCVQLVFLTPLGLENTLLWYHRAKKQEPYHFQLLTLAFNFHDREEWLELFLQLLALVHQEDELQSHAGSLYLHFLLQLLDYFQRLQ